MIVGKQITVESDHLPSWAGADVANIYADKIDDANAIGTDAVIELIIRLDEVAQSSGDDRDQGQKQDESPDGAVPAADDPDGGETGPLGFRAWFTDPAGVETAVVIITIGGIMIIIRWRRSRRLGPNGETRVRACAVCSP